MAVGAEQRRPRGLLPSVELDPALKRYFVTSAHDDIGLWQTYNHLVGLRTMLQPLASSGAFITLLNAGLTGVFAALVAVALNAPGPLVGVVAAVCGLSFLAISVTLGMRHYQRIWRRYVALFPALDTAVPETPGRPRGGR